MSLTSCILSFLIAWEVMALASYFLVVFEDEKEEARRAGRTYLIATHLSAGTLFVLFLARGQRSRSLDFDLLHGGATLHGAATAAFLVAGGKLLLEFADLLLDRVHHPHRRP